MLHALSLAYSFSLSSFGFFSNDSAKEHISAFCSTFGTKLRQSEMKNPILFLSQSWTEIGRKEADRGVYYTFPIGQRDKCDMKGFSGWCCPTWVWGSNGTIKSDHLSGQSWHVDQEHLIGSRLYHCTPFISKIRIQTKVGKWHDT